jgi:23S rRNA (uracil1939-C5)-methyltransferase
VVGALAGEEVEARVLGAHGKVVEARTERVFKASELRRPAPCVHAGRCGGCSVQHLPHGEQLALKQRMLAEQLSRVAGVEPQEWAAPLSGPEFGYRRRARVAVRWDAKAKRLEVGFRAVASQDIVAIDRLPGAGTGLATDHAASAQYVAAPEQTSGPGACRVVQRLVDCRVAAAYGAAVRR